MKIFLKKYANTMIAFLYAIIVWIWIFPRVFNVGHVILAFWNYQEGVVGHFAITLFLLGFIPMLELAVSLFLISFIVFKINQHITEQSCTSQKHEIYAGYGAGTFVSFGTLAIRLWDLSRSPYFDIISELLIPSVLMAIIVFAITFLLSFGFLMLIYVLANKWENIQLIKNKYKFFLATSLLLFVAGGIALMNYTSIIKLLF